MDEEGRYRRQQRRAVFGCVLAGVATVAAMVVLAVVGLAIEFGRPSDRSMAEFQAEGDQIVDKLEAYKVRHRCYPADLTSAQITPPTHYRGDWHYWAPEDGSRFGLWMRIRNHGALIYDPDAGWSFARSESLD